MNTVILMGRLTKDAEVRSTESGLLVARFTLAVDKYKKEDGANFIQCKCFGKTAENLERLVGKGTKIVVQGSWETGSYKNRDGATVYTNECLVQRWEFCEPKAKDESKKSIEEWDGNIPEDLPFT